MLDSFVHILAEVLSIDSFNFRRIRSLAQMLTTSASNSQLASEKSFSFKFYLVTGSDHSS
jgi:hypothetical protein